MNCYIIYIVFFARTARVAATSRDALCFFSIEVVDGRPIFKKLKAIFGCTF